MTASWRVWWQAVRPRTFGASLAPVLLGWGLARWAGHLDPLPALAALSGALLLQVGANLANDYADGISGVDSAARVGPVRAVQSGLLPAERVRAAAIAAFAGATAAGIVLTACGGWPVAALGLGALALAVGYTSGPWPLSHLGLGEAAAFICCGPVAVAGTMLGQHAGVPGAALALSCGTGLLAAAIMGVNNLRDRHTDVVAGKRTLAVRFGERPARAAWFVAVAAAFALPAALVGAGLVPLRACLALAALPLAVAPARLVARADGPALNAALAGTGRLMLAYGVLLAVGLGWPG